MGTAEHQDLVRRLLVAISATNICRVWAQNTGMAYRDGRAVKFGVIGGADISGIMRDGRRLEIEVKTGRAVQRQSQLNFETMINKYNGIYIVARDIDTVLDTLKKKDEEWVQLRRSLIT